jgi:hypothetical protein
MPKANNASDDDSMAGSSLCLLAVFDFVHHPRFEAFIVFTIIWNAVIMAICGPEPKKDTAEAYLSEWTGNLSVPIFTAEALLKMYCLGLIKRKYSYFRDAW